jgi:YVTN family beta-propeller protein
MRLHLLLACTLVFLPCAGARGELRRLHTIRGGIAPKSVVHDGRGLFFAQNMMYRHTVTVYDRRFRLVKTIGDSVTRRFLGLEGRGTVRGSPVECAFSPDGRKAWVSNYQMYGKGFDRPGSDNCDGRRPCDKSYLYRIDVPTLKIDRAARVGAVPKYVAVTPDGRLVLATNWCTYDLSLVDATTCRELGRVRLGRFPRGIAVSPDSGMAFVALLGGRDIARVDLKTLKVTWMRGVGLSPRHLCLEASGRWLYASLNGEGRVAKIDPLKGKPVAYARTGRQPRSMSLSADGKSLFVVNYASNSMSRVRTADMKVTETVKTPGKPIGIAVDDKEKTVWVSCYEGAIAVFVDR